MNNQPMKAFAVTLALTTTLSPLPSAEKPDTGTRDTASPKLPPPILSFMAAKERQARALAKRLDVELTPDITDFLAAATNGDCIRASDLMSIVTSLRDGAARSPVRPILVEMDLAIDLFCEGDAPFLLALGREMVKAIPAGSIYLGGTDAGRGLVTALCTSHDRGDPFFTATQNALSDNLYLEYLGAMYGERIHVPTSEDSQRAFQEYLDDAQRRLEHDQKHPGEPRQVRPGEDIRMANNRVQVSGQVAVMAINGLLAKMFFDKNPDREFFVEESFPLDWMYPHLAPQGPIMKLNRKPLEALPTEALARDRQYWSDQLRPWIGGWLKPDTSVAEICGFAEKVFVQKDLAGYTGDAKFVDALQMRKVCSKLRSSIGGVYAWRATNTRTPEDRDRMQKEADFAFRQAFALCPSSPEALFRYVNLLIAQGRVQDARRLVQTASKIDPANRQLDSVLKELDRIVKQ